MKTVAFFNNKGGVGKTSLVYHLAWMCSELGQRVIAADLDPQANLSSMFLSEEKLTRVLKGENRKTLDGDIAPLFEGKGDISKEPHLEEIDERMGLLVGDLGLSKREDELSSQWTKCLESDERAFRVTTVFARLIDYARQTFGADIVLIDVGPNLGAINRAALVASDHVVIPLAPDLFSLQGLRNVGPTLRGWREGWRERVSKKPEGLALDLPSGNMQPLGYILMRHSVRLNRPVQAFAHWIEKMPQEYSRAVLQEAASKEKTIENDPHLLAYLKGYRSLMPLAREANKPMFMLKPADGVFGARQHAVTNCYNDFKSLAKEIMQRIEGE